jgi:hypothetical protein
MRRPRSPSLTVVPVLAAAALVAGCGGGGTETVTVTTQVTPATETSVTAPTISVDTAASVPTDTVATSLTEITPTQTDDVPTTGPTDTTGTPTGTSTTSTTSNLTVRYLRNVLGASRALTAFGRKLQNIDDPSELRAAQPILSNYLDTFDENIARLDGYRLDVPRLEAQRARLAAAGPNLSDTLRRFLDAVREALDTGNAGPLQQILPQVQTGIQEFVQAAR